MNEKAKKAPLTRQEIRDQLLGHAPKPETKLITLFGTEIELRQPTIGAILDAQDTEDSKERMAEMIIRYAFVPGTKEPVFEGGDREMILNWPYNEDILALQDGINALTGIDVEGAEEDIETSPLKGQSSSTALN